LEKEKGSPEPPQKETAMGLLSRSKYRIGGSNHYPPLGKERPSPDLSQRNLYGVIIKIKVQNRRQQSLPAFGKRKTLPHPKESTFFMPHKNISPNQVSF